ncbi:MAG: glycosyltransferase family 4 protein [Bacteroidetes bacterium]|nr:glycosyltransferase family 4 protein [Bacteroidota bacterium]
MKKALIITYYWPPCGGGGVQRWLKFVKYLPEYGWKSFVAVPENPEYPVIDTTLLEDVPEDAEIIHLPIWEPYNIFKKLTGRKKEEKVNAGLLFDDSPRSLMEKFALWIRGNFLIPDPRVFWVRPSIRRLTKQIEIIKPSVIITTGPPHSVHLIGRGLKKKFREIMWIADFRDPWSEFDILDNFYPTKLALTRQRTLEKRVLDLADIVLSVSPTWAEKLQEFTQTPVKFLPNGYDYEDFTSSSKATQNKFIIAYTGILNSYRNPLVFCKALEEVCLENSDFNDHLEINIFGISDTGLNKILFEFPSILSKTTMRGYVSHNDVIHHYAKSSCLLLLLNNTKNSKGHMPGKFFEYLAAKKPILAIGPSSSDTGKIIKELKSGMICESDDKENIKKAIIEIYVKWKSNTTYDMKDISEFSRSKLTEKLVGLFNNK